MTAFSVPTRNFPPSGIASREFTARFKRIWFTCDASTTTVHRPLPGKNRISISSPMSRPKGSIKSETKSFRFAGMGAIICWHENPSKFLVISFDRFPAFSISEMYLTCRE